MRVFKTFRLFAAVALPFCALVVTSGLIGAQADPPPQAAMATYDTDKDGTIDQNEVSSAASAAFDKMDTDKDGTLDQNELQGRLTKRQFSEADPDNDATLTKNEYIVFVTKAFRAANPDGDSTVDVSELQTGAGRALLILLQQ